MTIKITRCLFGVLLISMFLVSCGSRKDIVYLQDFENNEKIVNDDDVEPRFKANDIVSIFVSAYDMEAVTPFNLSNGEGENAQAVDYIVDKDGYIDYPVLGKIQLKGKTVSAAKDIFISKLGKYLKDPIVNIRIKNYRVTVLGAVKNPGTYLISGERITILEAIGLAGDLDIKGIRDNVLVIRDVDGTKVSTRVNLKSKDFLHSPVYYLSQNDVVYVEPNKSAITASKIDTRVSIILSILGIMATLAVVLTR